MISARAAVLFDAGADPILTGVQLREPVGDEVLVRIDAVGICHTDISVAARWSARRLPMVFGHEGTGTVAAAGPDAGLRTGQRVVLTFASCQRCERCARDEPAYCERANQLNLLGDGGAERAVIHSDGAPVGGGFFGQSSLATVALARRGNAVAIEGDIDPALAAPLGCSVQTGVGTMLTGLAVEAGDSVAIFGAGAVGLSAVMGARIAGARHIVAVDPVPHRRELASRLGATAAIDPTGADAAAAVIEATGGGATAAVDTTAIPDVIATAVTALRARGALALVGLGVPNATLPVGLIMGKGLTVRGVVEGDSRPHQFIPRLVELWRTGDLPLEHLVSTYDFESFDRAWADAKAGQVVKPVLVTGR